MADMPTIYPMRFPSIPAERRPSSIDDLLPSTYMGQPSPFNASMQQVGKMLQAKKDDSDQANEAALKFGPSVAPGQIAALNDYLFRRGGQPYGGVMSPDGSNTPLSVPGSDAPLTAFNTAGQVRAQTDAEQVAALKFKQDRDASIQQMAHDKLDQNQKQFEARSQQRKDELAEKTSYHEHTNARLLTLGTKRLAIAGEGMQLKRAADEASKRAGQAFSNARSFASQASALEKAMASDFTMSPEVKAQRQETLAQLHQQSDDEMKRGYDLDSRTNQYIDQALGPVGGSIAPPTAPVVSPKLSTTPFVNAGQNPRFPQAAWGSVDGVPGWYQKDAQGNKTKVE